VLSWGLNTVGLCPTYSQVDVRFAEQNASDMCILPLQNASDIELRSMLIARRAMLSGVPLDCVNPSRGAELDAVPLMGFDLTGLWLN
jgi:hypothetical protein